jgi:hypothetical protein
MANATTIDTNTMTYSNEVIACLSTHILVGKYQGPIEHEKYRVREYNLADG